MRRLLSVLVLVLFASIGQAEVRFPSVIGDNMVLQRGEAVPLWGWDDAGAKVTVTIGDTTTSTTAGAEGAWAVYLPAMKAGGPHEIVVTGTSAVTSRTGSSAKSGSVPDNPTWNGVSGNRTTPRKRLPQPTIRGSDTSSSRIGPPPIRK